MDSYSKTEIKMWKRFERDLMNIRDITMDARVYWSKAGEGYRLTRTIAFQDALEDLIARVKKTRRLQGG